MTCRDDIQRVLAENVERAKSGYDDAQKEFKAAMDEIPSSLPEPDGTGRIRIAGSNYRHAMRTYSEALRESNEFISQAIVPEWLKKEGDEPGAAASGS